MTEQEFIKKNENGWNILAKNGHYYTNTVLPEYGLCHKRNEENLHLFDKLQGSNILDIGCGSGKSLKYLYDKGASDIWGIDVSKEQIKKAKDLLPEFENQLLIGAMEEENSLPHNYFDYIYSIHSIGYSSNLNNTLKYIYKYLKDDGVLIISWNHPFFFSLSVEDNKVIMNKSYFNNKPDIIVKGEDKVELIQYNSNISTMINSLSKNGFYVEQLIEEKSYLENDESGYKSVVFVKEKTDVCPTTIIYKCKKIKNR